MPVVLLLVVPVGLLPYDRKRDVDDDDVVIVGGGTPYGELLGVSI